MVEVSTIQRDSKPTHSWPSFKHLMKTETSAQDPNNHLKTHQKLSSYLLVVMYEQIWLVASTPLKNMSQLGLLFPI